MKIPLFQITVNDGRREADPEAVQKLAESISKVGLINPITVDKDYTLIAGLHRLEAAKMLGWAEIECTVNDLDGLLAELAEIDENLIRRKLHYTDEGKQLARRKEIYEALHPETQQGKRNGQTSKKDTVSVLETKPFAEDAAEQLGTTARSVRRKIQVSQNLAPEVQDLAKKENIRFRDALKLSRLPPDQQEDAARQLAAETIHSVDDYHPAPVETAPPPGEEQEASAALSRTASVSGEACYPTIRDSVADLKNPDKDRRRTPDTFLASFFFFLQRFCQGVENYATPEYAAVFPALTRQQLEQIRQEVNSTCSALRNLLHKMERTAQNELPQEKARSQRGA